MRFKVTFFAVFQCLCVIPSARAAFNESTLAKKFMQKSADNGVIFARLSDGKILFENNADQLLSPASVTKVITGAAALSLFGPAFSFKTPVYYTGIIKDGRLKGDLLFSGNGDPFLVSEILWQTAIDLRHLGIKGIDGDIVIDDALFDSETRDESRKDGKNKSTHAYDAPVSAFAVNFNTVAIAVAPTTFGRPALATVTPFPMRSVNLSSKVTTIHGAADTGVAASRSNQTGGGIALQVSGSIGEDAALKKIYRSVSSPTVAAGDYIRGFLEDAGIKVKGRVRPGIVPVPAKLLYEIQGYEMRRIVAGLNTFSNNFIADMLTKRLGAAFLASDDPTRKISELKGLGTLKSGVTVLSRFLREDVGIKSNFTLINGSGLSTENRFSARQILSILTWVEKQGDLFPDFLGSLPASGWDGTLKKRIKKSTELAGMIRAKTGTLTDPITVASMAGYFRHPVEGWVAFVMMSNGRQGQGQPGLLELRNAQDDALKDVF